MYIGIDIGGTKTLVATLDDNGVILQLQRFPTDQDYEHFLRDVAIAAEQCGIDATTHYHCCVGMPGLLDRSAGIVEAMGNLPWRDKPIRDDLSRVLHGRSVIIENDAKLAGLSEAQLLRQYNKVLFATVSTGIGGALIVDGRIDKTLQDTEMGKMPLWHGNKFVNWEDFAGGRSLTHRYNQMAFQITDPAIWHEIGTYVAHGLAPAVSILTPDVVVLGGSVGAHTEKFSAAINQFFDKYLHPVVKRPVNILAAQRADNAVIYGCYDLAKQSL